VLANGGRRDQESLEQTSTDGTPVGRKSILDEIQRTRILQATVNVACERGATAAGVGLVIARARVSRGIFYEHFDSLDDALIAVLDEALARAAPLITRAFAGEGYWQDGMRSALAAMLDFFDSDPALARVCLVEVQTAAPAVREHRERILQAFRALVVQRIQGEVSHASPLAAEGTHASVIGIVNARLNSPQQQPLIELLGPLMGIIVAPFMDETHIAREIQRGHDLAQQIIARRSVSPQPPSDANVAAQIPDFLLNARAHRARLCLLYVVERPGASNQQVGDGIGVSHRGQVARLLKRLAAFGLVTKHPGGPGHANAWTPTTTGQHMAHALTNGTHHTAAHDVYPGPVLTQLHDE
jgi:AcrR family transcriptional regulator